MHFLLDIIPCIHPLVACVISTAIVTICFQDLLFQDIGYRVGVDNG